MAASKSLAASGCQHLSGYFNQVVTASPAIERFFYREDVLDLSETALRRDIRLEFQETDFFFFTHL
jgi:hypothetical protein